MSPAGREHSGERAGSQCDQIVRQTGSPETDADRDEKRGRGHRDRHKVGTTDGRHETGHERSEVLWAGHRHTECELQLSEHDQQRGARGETDQHRGRGEVRQLPHARESERQLEHADHEREHDGGGDELRGSGLEDP